METKAEGPENITEEEAMDRLLYILVDHLSPAAMAEIDKILIGIREAKSFTDMTAYLVVEFNTKLDAAEAKAKGFEYSINGQVQRGNFVTTGIVSCFMRQKFKSLGANY